MAKTKKYKCEDGSYLVLDRDYKGQISIAWYVPEYDETGMGVGEDWQAADEAPKEKSDWECWMASVAAAPYAAEGRTYPNQFTFESEKRARQALRAANEALLSGAPWPEWAIKAREAGWTPPKGWKP